MSDTFTTTTIAGYVGSDAELKATNSGTPMIKFPMPVTTEGRGGKESSTMWVNCIQFGARAEKIAGWIKKGKFVVVSGRMTVREYERTDGGSGYSVEMNVDNVGFGPRLSSEDKRQEEQRQTKIANDDIPF